MHSPRTTKMTPATYAIRALGVGALTLATTMTPFAAHADEPKPVYPSQQQVDAAKSAAGSAAEQVDQLDSQYQEASAKLESVQEAAAAAAEVSNGAQAVLATKSKAYADAAAAAAKAQAAATEAQQGMRDLASLAYQQNGSLGDMGAYLGGGGPQDLADAATAMDAIGAVRNRILSDADSASNVAQSAQANAETARQQQQSAADAADAARAQAQAQADAAAEQATQIQAQQQQMATKLAQLRKTSVATEMARQQGLAEAAAAQAAAEEAARLAKQAAERAATERSRKAAAEAAAAKAAAEAAAQAAREAAAKAAQQARDKAAQQARDKAAQPAPSKPAPTQPAPSKPAPAPAPPPPAASGVSAVLAYARAQVGKWYEWGAEGPNTFDCSGLTMMAWRQAGVYMSHYTGYQYTETRRVAIADLRPGDLVFYGNSGETSHHVGLYVGNGQMIEAPHTGAQVRYASIYRSDLLPYGGRPG